MEEKAASKKSRSLRRVVDRWPVTSVYIRETLECGHKLIVHPPTDSLIANYRTCPDCAKASSLPEKKPAASARIPSWRKEA